jgi:regulator of sigma E protease
MIINDFIHNLVSFIAIISVIIFVHEYGHYIVAKYFGVKIETFSIGFGKELFGWNDKSGTRWKVALIPMGGYVKMFGDANIASTPDKNKVLSLTEEERKLAFHTKPLYQKSLIVAAGPIFNFLLAILIFAVIFSIYGKYTASARLVSIEPNSVAAKHGLKEGDVIVKVGDERIRDFLDLQRAISLNPNVALKFSIKRNDEIIVKTITPAEHVVKDKEGNEIKIGRLGIISEEPVLKKYNFFKSIYMGAEETYYISFSIISSIKQMITGKRGIDDLGGPIRVAKFSGQSAKQGLVSVLGFVALLSINLGLINLFPIPVLDGGHLLYYAVEGIIRRPIPEQFVRYGFGLGLAIVIALTIFSTVNDLKFVKLFY